MTDFKKYSSIENSYRDKEISSIRYEGFDKEEWVATEKVHGANFGLYIRHGKARPAKRSGFADGAFYGCQPIVEAIEAKVLAVAREIEGFVAIHGELFGGGIQKGVNYGQKRFAAFDISTDTGFLNYDDFVAICDKVGIPRCVEIARGSFDDILALDPTFPTRMSDCGSVDTVEGFVMKPVVNRHFNSGSRVILKKKSPEFVEKAEGVREPKPPKEPLTEKQTALFDAAQPYICDERIRSAVSKFGPKEFNLVLADVLADIFQELEKDDLDSFDKSTYDSIRQEMCGLIAPIIRGIMFLGK